MNVRAKKHLGQHFLTDENIAKKIAESLTGSGYEDVLEIGPGMGVLTKFLIKKIRTSLIEIDPESVAYLKQHYPELTDRIHQLDFLKTDLNQLIPNRPFAVIGNFPYNISSQILFKTLENKAFIPEFAGMFQKEVAERVAEKPGSKTYGIMSVLLQAFYDIQYCFTVDEHVFNPPPKVKSGVIRCTRNTRQKLDCDEALFIRIVKMSFNQRRKTIRNSIKQLIKDKGFDHPMLNDRPERLSVEQFVELTKMVQALD
jgi:16S rRNA (adenine1518-N6/adenine1519-N6)-dimethyltransferase